MDNRMILGWSLAIMVLTGLLIYIRSREKKRKNRELDTLAAFAGKNSAEILTFDTWDRTLIGLDADEGAKLYFIRQLPEGEVREAIDITKVSACRVVLSDRHVTYGKEKVRVIDRIELVFTFSSHKQDLALEFYNNDYDNLTLSGELQIAEKWRDIVRARLEEYRMRRIAIPEKVLLSPVHGQADKAKAKPVPKLGNRKASGRKVA